MTDSTTHELAARYVAVWGEADAGKRRDAIEALWTDGGKHVLHPPQDIREAAAGLGFAAPALEVRGYDALEARVARAYQEFVADGKYAFRSAGDPVRLNDLVTFSWQMLDVAADEVVGGGLEILLLDDGDRIVTDYQIPNP
jgi:hypothetical protein